MTKTYTGFLVIILFVSVFLSGTGVVCAAAGSEYRNPSIAETNSSVYWVDKGGLLATYGNYPAAIKAYKKALDLDANFDEAYFNLALAYCAIGDYLQALKSIDQALALAPGNGHYQYGRGWIMLQARGPEHAAPYFQKAAELGDQDALDYLQSHGHQTASGT